MHKQVVDARKIKIFLSKRFAMQADLWYNNWVMIIKEKNNV